MTPEQLRAIEERCSKASWANTNSMGGQGFAYSVKFSDHGCFTGELFFYGRSARDDAIFYYNAHSDNHALVQEVKRLTEALTACELALNGCYDVVEYPGPDRPSEQRRALVKARAALATEKATAATEGNIPSLDTPEPSK